jgi:transposase
MSTTIAGIDISKAKFDVVLLLGDGRTKHRVFDNQPAGFAQLDKWLVQHSAGQVHACLEATGRYGDALAAFLHASGQAVSIVNPARIKKYAASQLRRNKTDKADAALIADFCRTQSLRLWHPPAAYHQELQAMVRYLASLQTAQRMEANRLAAAPPSATVCARIEAHLAFLDDQISSLRRDIQAFIDRHPDLKRQRELLTSIKGIGDLTAARFLAEVPDISAFDSARQLAAYAGLTPGRFDSGSSIHKPAHLVKTGNFALRRDLYFPAIVAKRYNPILHEFSLRLAARGLPPKAIVAALMRKLLHLAFGVLKHHRPFDPNFLAAS